MKKCREGALVARATGDLSPEKEKVAKCRRELVARSERKRVDLSRKNLVAQSDIDILTSSD